MRHEDTVRGRPRHTNLFTLLTIITCHGRQRRGRPTRCNDMTSNRRTNDPRAVPPLRYRTLFVMLVVFVLTGGEAAAEFHVWRDRAGHKHVSTVPARGYRAERTLRPDYDPNSIVYQHRRLRERLQLLDAELNEQAAMAQHETSADHPSPARRVPREGSMNLDELIALEKRGGRWVDEGSDQGGATRVK